MNLATRFLISLFKYGAAQLVGWFVLKGIITEGEAGEYVLAAATALAGGSVFALHSLYLKHKDKLLFLMALDAPRGTKPEAVVAAQKAGEYTTDSAGKVKLTSLVVLLAVLPSMMLSGCGLRGGARHAAVVGDTTIYSALSAFQDTEDTLFKVGKLGKTAEENAKVHQNINRYLAPALKTGDELNRTIRTWPVNQPAPAELGMLATQLRGLVEEGLELMPEGEAKTNLLAKLSPVQAAVMAVMALFLVQ